jgi:membrane protein implicated in regulation of membrane protease activity
MRFATEQWLYGLFAATVAAGAQAISGGFALAFIDPAHFNIDHPALIVKIMAAMFLFAAVPVFFAYLAQKPLPSITTTTETTTLEHNPFAMVTKTQTETKEKSA